MRDASSSSFLAISAGVRSRSVAMVRCSSGGSRLKKAQKSPSTTPLIGKYEERKKSWSRPQSGGPSRVHLERLQRLEVLRGEGEQRADAALQRRVHDHLGAAGPQHHLLQRGDRVAHVDCTIGSALLGAPLTMPSPEVSSCASSTSSETSCGSRSRKTLPNLSAPASVLTSTTHLVRVG